VDFQGQDGRQSAELIDRNMPVLEKAAWAQAAFSHFALWHKITEL
jgi:hypothetical protein